jgi:hypothetical protein
MQATLTIQAPDDPGVNMAARGRGLGAGDRNGRTSAAYR